MTVSNRGPRGIPGPMVAGYFDYHRIPNVDPQGAWASQTFTASGIFVAPTNGVFLNKNRKIDCYVTAIAGGGPGGNGVTGITDNESKSPQGGQSGYWTRRYKISLYPGEQVAVTIPGTTSHGSNGGSLVFGSYLTLSGGLAGADGQNSAPTNVGKLNPVSGGGSLSSGTVVGENAVFTGTYGGSGEDTLLFNDSAATGGWAIVPASAGQDNLTLGLGFGGRVNAQLNAGRSPQQGGGGGGGLFGKGGDGAQNGTLPAATSPDANSGGGGGGGCTYSSTVNGTAGAAGQLLVEWRIPA